MTAMLCATMWAQAPAQGQPQWKDRAEYDLVESVGKEADATKKIALLNQWKEKYPGSDFKKLRAAMYLQTYQALGQSANIYTAAKDVLAVDPADALALSMISYFTPVLANTSPEALDMGEKAANGILSQLGTIFEASKKPAQMTDQQWAQQKDIAEAQSYKTLGWIAMVRKDAPGAQTNFTKSLGKNAAQGDVSYWLGQTVMGMKKVELYPLGLFHVARAVAYDGPGAMGAQGRTQVDSYLKKAYAGYHGDDSGLEDLKKLAKAQPLPPADFKIKSVTDVQTEKIAQEQDAAKANPQLALWKRVKEELQGANGAQYWEAGMKDAGFGIPGADGTPKLTVSLVEQKSNKELIVAVADKTTPEMTLQLDAPLAGKAEPGTELTISGVAKSYTKEPFMVVMEVEKKDLKGWPAAAAPAKRPAAARKPGAAKRK
ncbi:MAG: hypothetical protein SGI92_27025 [Bryobacteraceae bacterium]|nr:hypothetical protein [Bryobacteraceae bacterium]